MSFFKYETKNFEDNLMTNTATIITVVILTKFSACLSPLFSGATSCPKLAPKGMLSYIRKGEYAGYQRWKQCSKKSFY